MSVLADFEKKEKIVALCASYLQQAIFLSMKYGQGIDYEPCLKTWRFCFLKLMTKLRQVSFFK